jgi:hypothetical protein
MAGVWRCLGTEADALRTRRRRVWCSPASVVASQLCGSVETCLDLAARAEELQRQTALRMNRTAMVREKRGRLLLAIRQTYHVRPCPSSRLDLAREWV